MQTIAGPVAPARPGLPEGVAATDAAGSGSVRTTSAGTTQQVDAAAPPGTAVAGVAAVVLVAGVVAAADPWGLRPYTTARWAVVGVAAAIAAACVRWRVPRPVAVVGAALLGWVAVASITAVEPLSALVGHPRRHLGLAGWVVCALALLAGTGLRARAARRWIARAVAAGGVVTGATVVADLAGWNPFGTSFAGGRVGGLLGQPLYLAVAALLVAPVAAGVAATRDEPRGWRVAGAAGCAGAVLALAASQTRGAWLGALVAGAMLGRRMTGRDRGLRAREMAAGSGPPASRLRGRAADTWGIGDGPAGKTGGRRRRRVVVLAGAVALAAGLVAGPRIAQLADGDAPGGLGRLDEWRVAAGVVADHPFTGVGPEGYRIAAPAHIDDGYTRRHGRAEVVDRAHSAPLDVAATAGVPAAVLYVALLGLVVARCARVIGHSRDPLLVAAAAGVAAWSVQQLVGFPVAEVDPLAWLLTGMVLATPLSRVRESPTTSRASAQPWASKWWARSSGCDGGVGAADDGRLVGVPAGVSSVVRVALVGGLAVVLGVVGVTAVVADRQLAQATDLLASRDVAGALASADRATELRPDDVDAWYLAARVAATPDGLPALDNGLDRVEAGLARLPGDPALRHLRTALLVERAQRSGLAADLAAAEASARALVADDPSSPAAHRALGLELAARGDANGARAALERALALDPDDAVARAALGDLRSRWGLDAGDDLVGER